MPSELSGSIDSRDPAGIGRRRLSVVVVDVLVEATDVVSIILKDGEGRDLPPWSPGAHVDVILPSGLVRQYSLCGDPDVLASYRIAVLRQPEGRGGSVEVHEQLRPGARVDILTPRNRFELVPARGYLFLAGGIGVTPLLPMVRQLARNGEQWQLIYGARSRSHLAFADELVTTSAGSVELMPLDECGLPDVEAAVRALPDDHLVYCCGPSPMIDAVQEVCRRLGRSDSLHVEHFVTGREESVPVAGTEHAFTVTLARSGLVLEIPSDRSILDVVRDAVPDVLFSCGEGDCGTCETRVVDGSPDHRDLVLTDDERESGDTMMICVSRALGQSLTLDL